MLGLGSTNKRRGTTIAKLSGFKDLVFIGKKYIRQYTFHDRSSTATRSSNLPTDWQCTISGTDVTVYGSTNETSITSNRGWVFEDGTTGSNGTGPGGGVDWNWVLFSNLADGNGTRTTPNEVDRTGVGADGTNIVSGAWESTKPHYLFYESSSGGASASSTFRHPIRTEAIDVSHLAANTPLFIEFWVHAYGTAFGGASNDSGKGLGIAVTTATASCSSADEAGTGLGFTSDTAGGADILVTKTDGTSLTTKRIGGTGQIQTSGHTSSLSVDNHWVKCIADITAASGSSDDIYIYFCNFTSHEGLASNNFFTQDICIQNIGIYHQV